MANWCYNYVFVSGEAEMLEKFMKEIKSLKCLSEETGKGVLPDYVEEAEKILNEDRKSKYDRYLFELDIQSDDTFRCETKWAPPIEELGLISTHYPLLSFEMEYEECGCRIFGKCFIKDGVIKDVFLEGEDFDKIEYDEDKDRYIFEGEEFESDNEILEDLLTDKINKQNG